MWSVLFLSFPGLCSPGTCLPVSGRTQPLLFSPFISSYLSVNFSSFFGDFSKYTIRQREMQYLISKIISLFPPAPFPVSASDPGNDSGYNPAL
jgi:hypothetical protein